MNTYSRRYTCSCGVKDRVSRKQANTGMIMCYSCGEVIHAAPLFRGNEEERERTIKDNKGETSMNWDILLAAMILVESSGNDKAVGDAGLSVGCLQIQPAVIYDVNRWYFAQYDLDCRLDRGNSIMICKRWLTKRMRDASIATGLPEDYEMAARLWNGGYKGYINNRKATDEYWGMVKWQIERLGTK